MKTGIPIIYGSQSGNSIHVANIIQEELSYIPTQVISIENFSLENFVHPHTFIFVCSTYGNGDFPFCGQHFYNCLISDLFPKDFLKKTNIAIFGLGDSSYAKFNFASQKLFKAFENLGSNMIIERGIGNIQDKNGYYTALYPWIQSLKSKLIDIEIENFDLKINENTEYEVNVVSKNILTPQNYEPIVLEVGFQIQNYENFEPGDTISIPPDNYNSKEFANFLGIEPEDEYIKKKMGFNSIPFFKSFEYIATFLKDQNYDSKFFIRPNIKNLTINKIIEFSKDFESYYSYVKLEKRSFFDVFIDLGIKLPMNFLRKIIPNIQPRYFTLTKKNNLYFITITLVDFQIGMRKKKGLCSEYFRTINLFTKFKAKMIKSHLNYDSDNLLFICTGTGITLARSFWNYFKDKKILIFFGYRFDDKDKIYSSEMESQSNITIIYSPSRMGQKKYVQNIFEEKFNENINSYQIYVSGRTRLNREVREMFKRKYGEELYFQAETW